MLSEKGKNKIKRDRRKRSIQIGLSSNLILEIDNIANKKLKKSRSETIQSLIEYALGETTKHLRAEKNNQSHL